MAIAVQPLNSLERTKLRKAEKTIRNGQQTFLDVGNALIVIRDGNLFRETHKSFKAYCRDKWGFEDRYARRLISGAEVVKRLESTVQSRPLPSGGGSGPIGTLEPPPSDAASTPVPSGGGSGPVGPLEPPDSDTISAPGETPHSSVQIPTNEWQLRALAKLPEDQQAAAWADAVEAAGGQPTGAQVEEVVKTYLADNEPPEEDEEPPEEPDTAAGLMKEDNSQIESFCRRLMKMVNSEMPDTAWMKVGGHRNHAIEKIKHACQILRSCKGVEVCPNCDGEGCRSTCKNIGYITGYVRDQLK